MEESIVMIIGVTGGVGAGKSTVLAILKEEYRALVIEMDAVGKMLMEPDGPCFGPTAALFGNACVREDGTLDRAAIADIVFHDGEMLEKLNGIIHPAVRAYTDEKIEEARKSDISYIVLESALLLDAGYDAVCDEVWYIYAAPEVRAERLMKSRGYSKERIRAVMDAQKDDAFFRSRADFIVDNSGDVEETKEQIQERLKTL